MMMMALAMMIRAMMNMIMNYDDPKERMSIEKEGVSVHCEPFSRNFLTPNQGHMNCDAPKTQKKYQQILRQQCCLIQFGFQKR